MPAGGYHRQAFVQTRPPLIEQTADPCRAAAAQLQTHALNCRPFAAGQHRIRGSKYLIFRHLKCQSSTAGILGLIIKCYPSLFFGYCKIDTFNVLNRTVQASPRQTP